MGGFLYWSLPIVVFLTEKSLNRVSNMSIKAFREQSVKLKSLPHPLSPIPQPTADNENADADAGENLNSASVETNSSPEVVHAMRETDYPTEQEASPLQTASDSHNSFQRHSTHAGADDDFDLDSVLGQLENIGDRDRDSDADSKVIQEDSAASQFEQLEIRVSPDAPLLGVIQVYKLKCLNCTHLVPAAGKEYNECHYSAGNKLCPASSMKIIQHIPIDKILRAFKEAENSGNLGHISRLYAQIAKRPDWVQQRINDELRKARARKDW